MLPNFIIVGAPKAGTTSLYHYLSEHPEVFMSTPKEVNYFSWEEIESQNLFYNDLKIKDLNEYKNLFDSAKGKKAIGEGSVSYLFYPGTAAKIKSCIPNAKIIITLRNPVDRGFSHYLMDYRLGLVDLPYEDIIQKKSVTKKIHLYYQQYIELGLYYEQVKRYIDVFGSRQVKIYFQEELRQNTEDVISDLYDFLDIDRSFMPKIEIGHNAFSMPKYKLIHALYSTNRVRSFASSVIPSRVKELLLDNFFERKRKPVLGTETRKELLTIYEPDIKNLEKLINKDLSGWYQKE